MASRSSLMSAFKTIREAWPVVEERVGRDLGQYIRGSYAVSFKEHVSAGGDRLEYAKKEVKALEALQQSSFKQRYQREVDTTFTGDLGDRFGFAKLNTSAQREHNMPSFMDRLFGRKLPSQWNTQTKSRDAEQK